MQETEQKNIYNNGVYLDNHPTWHCEDSLWKAKHIIKLLNKNNINPVSICEAGCGAGEILCNLYRQLPDNIDYFGYDISKDAHILCKTKENERLHFYLKDITNENDKYFDLLMLIDVVEHIEDYIGFIKKIKDKGKYKFFKVPLEISARRALFPSCFLKSRKINGHIHYFNKEMFLAVLEDCGYKVVDVYCTYDPFKVVDLKSAIVKILIKSFNFINKDLALNLIGGYSLFVIAQ